MNTNLRHSSFGSTSNSAAVGTRDRAARENLDTAGPRTSSGAGRSFEGRLLRRLLHSAGDPPLEFQLAWSGEAVATHEGGSNYRARIADRATLFSLLRNPQINFGDAYSAGRIEIEGDLIDFVGMIYRHLRAADERHPVAAKIARWLRRPSRNTLAGSRDHIHRHYDLGNEFYALWLGDSMAYTCAYFPEVRATLDAAQTAKMDHVCRKLQLSSGDSVVEAGCGWGSLALHMAGRYGATVRAFNISKEQIEFARARARAAGLCDRIEFVEDDYRNISGRHDVFVSVGMLEHVGRDNYREFGRVARNALDARGRGLVHSIGRNRPLPLHPWIERRIFPGAYAPSIGEMVGIFEPWHLSVLDVENLRPHYALTLRHWLERFEAVLEQVRALSFDETFIRMWRLYLAGSIAAFETGNMQLFQVLFTTEDNIETPLTRDFIYSR